MIKINKIVQEELSKLSEKQKRKILHGQEDDNIKEATVTQRDVGKAHDE